VVKIAPPPPINPPSPSFFDLPVGSNINRIFDPTKYQTQALTFRYNGPRHRFDHHRGSVNHPSNDPVRGVYYAAFTLSGCLVECFGDTGIIEIKTQCVAFVTLKRAFKLLDLRGSGAMKAGSVAALAKTADRVLSQQWSRYFYEHEQIYSEIDGIIYFNAHNDEEALAFYERASDGLSCDLDQIMSLNSPQLRPAIKKAASENNLFFED